MAQNGDLNCAFGRATIIYNKYVRAPFLATPYAPDALCISTNRAYQLEQPSCDFSQPSYLQSLVSVAPDDPVVGYERDTTKKAASLVRMLDHVPCVQVLLVSMPVIVASPPERWLGWLYASQERFSPRGDKSNALR